MATVQELKAVVTADISNYDQGMDRVGRGADDVATKTDKASKATDRFGSSASTAKDILGAFGVALTLDRLVDFGRDALGAANDLEKTEAVVRTISGSQARYNEVLDLATAGQSKYGGSLQNQLEGLRGLVPLANRYGLELEQLDNVSRRLAVSSPEQGIQGASFAIKEFLASGDTLSLIERFELSRGELNKLKEAAGGDLQARLDGLSQIMDELGYTQETLAAATQTNANTYDRLGASTSNATVALGKFLQEGLKPAAEGAIILADALSGKGLNEALSNVLSAATDFSGIGLLGGDSTKFFSDRLAELGIQTEETKAKIDLGATAYDVYSIAAQDAAKGTREQADAAKLSAEETEKLQKTLEQTAERGTDAEERLADARERYDEQTVQKHEDYARKLENVERETGERITTIDRDYAERRASNLAEAQAELASLARDGSQELLSAQQDYQAAQEEAARSHGEKLADLALRQVDLTRDYASTIEDIDRDLADKRASEAERTADKLADIQQRFIDTQRALDDELASQAQSYEDRLADLQTKSADNRSDREQDHADKLTDLHAKLGGDLTEEERQRIENQIAIAEREYQQQEARLARDEARALEKLSRDRARDEQAALEKAERQRAELEQQRIVEETAAQQRLARLDEEDSQKRAKATESFTEKQADLDRDVAAEQEAYDRKTAQRQAAYDQERAETIALFAERTTQVQAQSEAELGELATKYERERAQRLADAQQKIDDLESSFTIEEERRAQSFARQEEQMREAFGKQLDIYIATQQAMGLITIEEANRRRQVVAEEFGVTQNRGQAFDTLATQVGANQQGAAAANLLSGFGINFGGALGQMQQAAGVIQQNTIIIQDAADPQQTALAVRDELERLQRQNGSIGITP